MATGDVSSVAYQFSHDGDEDGSCGYIAGDFREEWRD